MGIDDRDIEDAGENFTTTSYVKRCLVLDNGSSRGLVFKLYYFFLQWFFEPATQPKCLSDYSIRSTQHIYFQSSTSKYFC